MSEPYLWRCAECGAEQETAKHYPPPGWCWGHFYSTRLRAPSSLLACSEEHARRAVKRDGRLTKIEVVAP